MNVTLITGASGGIGEAFARRLATEGHNLLLVARSEAKLRQLCDELTAKYTGKVQYVALDLTLPDADRHLFEETQNRGLVVDCLINNAGIGSAGDFARLDLADELAMIQLNVSVLVALTQRYLQPMRQRGKGTLINVGSMAGFGPIPYMATYAATKLFVRSFTEAITEENRPYGIRVMLLVPGATETGFFDAAKIGTDNKSQIGVRETQTPGEVVEAALNGLQKGRETVISGTKNAMLARLIALVPNRFMARTFARQIGPNFRPKNAS